MSDAELPSTATAELTASNADASASAPATPSPAAPAPARAPAPAPSASVSASAPAPAPAATAATAQQLSDAAQMMEVLTSVQRHMQGNATVMMGAIFALLMGLTPAVVTLAVYFVIGGDAAACDRPLARWLLVNGIVAASVQLLNFAVLPHLAVAAKRAMAAGDDARLARSRRLSNLFTCITCPTSFFWSYWYVQGNIWLWGTAPFNASVTEQLADGALTAADIAALEIDGCDAGMWQGTRTWFVATYVLSALICGCACCCVPCMCVLYGVQQQQRAQEAV